MIDALIRNLNEYHWLWDYNVKKDLLEHRSSSIIIEVGKKSCDVNLKTPCVKLNFMERKKLYREYKRWVKIYIETKGEPF